MFGQLMLVISLLSFGIAIGSGQLWAFVTLGAAIAAALVKATIDWLASLT